VVYDFVKEYESVPYAAHLKWGPIQVRHHICYITCIVVSVTDIAGCSPFNFFNLNTRTRHTNPNSFRHILQTSKDCYKYSYFPRSITLWNQLPTTFTTADTVDGFKSMILVCKNIVRCTCQSDRYSLTLTSFSQSLHLYISSRPSLLKIIGHSWRFQEHDPSICLDSNFHTIITHSSYQMYIVLTFNSLFIVYMLTYVLTKFNTALGQ
jgi:hypothetical protein